MEQTVGTSSLPIPGSAHYVPMRLCAPNRDKLVLCERLSSGRVVLKPDGPAEQYHRSFDGLGGGGGGVDSVSDSQP